jgi:UDP-N-acetylglucosamine 1-carboxyvinyltransferase
MERIVLEGGRRLNGRVKVSGSKNASLPIMAACLLVDGPCDIENVPRVKDLQTMCQMLRLLGATAEYQGQILHIDPAKFSDQIAPYELVKTMRASIYVLAPLLARFGNARVALPGGCAIGLRPIDQHLKGLKCMGAEVVMEHGYIHAHAPHGLQGAEIYLDVVSVGATVNIMLAAALAKGKTIVEHAACEPEIIHLAGFLNALGAKVQGAGTSRIVIEGVTHLSPVPHRIIPDRIEAGTLAIAAAITRGDIIIDDFPMEDLTALERKFVEAGIVIEPVDRNSVRVYRKDENLASVDIVTQPFPGFPTDLQAQWMALMCFAPGRAVITETIWENRFMHVAELKRMGADIQIEGNSAMVKGGRVLSGAPVMASDLRASAALILAGLMAEGETRVSRIYHLDRGYEHLEQKLAALGAKIRREPDPGI